MYISFHSKWAYVLVRVVAIPGLPVKQYRGHPKGTSEALVFRDGSHPEDTTVYYLCPPLKSIVTLLVGEKLCRVM